MRCEAGAETGEVECEQVQVVAGGHHQAAQAVQFPLNPVQLQQNTRTTDNRIKITSYRQFFSLLAITVERKLFG